MEVENEFKGYHVNLVKERMKSKTTVWAIAIVAIVAIGTTWGIPSMVAGYLNDTVLVTKEGDVVRVGSASSISALQVEILSHLDYTFNTYYTYNQANVDAKRETGGYLFSTGALRDMEAKWANWVVDVKSQGLVQTTVLVPESVQVTNNTEEGFHIVAEAIMSVQNESYINKYRLTIEGDVLRIERNFPLNRHGMQYFNYADNIVEIESNIPVE